MSAAEIIAKSGKKNDALAKEMLELWQREAPKEKKPAPRSLGTMIGNLRRGETDWWKARPDVTARLARVLGCEPEALLAAPGAAREIPSRDFPGLKPLRPDEDAAPVWRRAWLSDYIKDALRERRLTWLIAAPGLGKETAARYLHLRRGDLSIVEAETVLAASRQADPADARPLVIVVRASDAATDALGLQTVASRTAPAVIVAPFGPPTCDALDAWMVQRMELPPSGWRAGFVEWVARRVSDDSRLPMGPALEMLEAFDPIGDVLATPGDVMPLLSFMFAGNTDASVLELSDTLVTDRLAHSGCPTRMIERVRRGLASATAAALEREAREQRPSTTAQWAELIDSDAARPATRAAREAALDALEKAPAKDRSRRRAELEKLLDAGAPAEVIEALRAGGILVEDEHGLDVFPRWVRRAYERRAIDAMAQAGDWTRIGTLAATPHLRPIVLDTLLQHERRDLVRLAARLLRSEQRSFAWVAAAEVLFEAIAERLTPELDPDSPWKPHADDLRTLTALGRLQAHLAAMAGRATAWKEPTRLTATPERRFSTENGRWLMCAWGFSLAVPAPPDFPREAGWAFPGWLSSAPPEAWLPTIPDRRQVPQETWELFVKHLRVATRVVRAKPELVTIDAPPIIRVAALLTGPHDVPRAELEDLLANEQAAMLFVELLREETDPAARIAIATRLWRAMKPRARHNPVTLLATTDQARRELFAESLPVEVFLEDMDVADVLLGLHIQESRVDMLPDRLLHPFFDVIVDPLVRYEHEPSVSLPGPVGRLVSRTVLTRLLDARISLPREAAARLWTLDPELALAELDRRLEVDPNATACLIDTSPTEMVTTILERVRRAPVALWAHFVPRWMANRVGAGAADASMLYDALVRLPEFALPADIAAWQ